MDEVVEETLRHISQKSKEHIITTTYSDEILLADMDARLIMQVIINLVDNATNTRRKAPGSIFLRMQKTVISW